MRPKKDSVLPNIIQPLRTWWSHDSQTKVTEVRGLESPRAWSHSISPDPKIGHLDDAGLAKDSSCVPATTGRPSDRLA